MISSLQAHNTLLKNEVTRSKKRTSELAVQIAKCRDKQVCGHWTVAYNPYISNWILGFCIIQ